MSRLNKLIDGVGWGTASVIVTTGFQLVFMAVMARLLAPADFGLVAIAGISLRFFQYFAQLGVQPALIQKPKIDEGDVRAALVVSLGVATLFFFVTLVAAPFFERFFNIAELASVIRVLALNFIIGGFSAVSIGLLYRTTRFKSIALMGVISYVLGYGVVGLGMAYTGHGVWSLVSATLSQAIISALWAYTATRHAIGWSFTATQWRHFFSFGGKYSIVGFLEFLTSFLGEMFVGKLFGASAVGIYNRSNLIVELPVQQPVNILRKTLFPIACSLRNDSEENYYSSLLYGILIVGSISFAISVGIAIAAPDIVGVLLGEKWLATIPVIQILAVSVPFRSVTQIMTMHFEVIGALYTKIQVQSIMLISLIVLLLLLYPYGLTGIALAAVLSGAVRTVLYFTLFIKRVHVPFSDAINVASIFSLITIATGGSVLAITVLMPESMPSAFRLIFDITAGGAGLVSGGILSMRFLARLPAQASVINKFPVLSRLVGWNNV